MSYNLLRIDNGKARGLYELELTHRVAAVADTWVPAHTMQPYAHKRGKVGHLFKQLSTLNLIERPDGLGTVHHELLALV